MSQDKLGKENVVLKEYECSASFNLQRKARYRWGNSAPHFLPPSNFRKIFVVTSKPLPLLFCSAVPETRYVYSNLMMD